MRKILLLLLCASVIISLSGCKATDMVLSQASSPISSSVSTITNSPLISQTLVYYQLTFLPKPIASYETSLLCTPERTQEKFTDGEDYFVLEVTDVETDEITSDSVETLLLEQGDAKYFYFSESESIAYHFEHEEIIPYLTLPINNQGVLTLGKGGFLFKIYGTLNQAESILIANGLEVQEQSQAS